jgi:hypothetical protein
MFLITENIMKRRVLRPEKEQITHRGGFIGLGWQRKEPHILRRHYKGKKGQQSYKKFRLLFVKASGNVNDFVLHVC